MGSAVEALLDDELSPSGVLGRLDRDDAFPQRAVGGQSLETGRDLAEDVDQPVVIKMIYVTVINENNAILHFFSN